MPGRHWKAESSTGAFASVSEIGAPPEKSHDQTSQAPSGIAAATLGSPISGYTNNRNNALTYDYAGNVLSDGLHTYSYDAESRIRQVDGGAVTFAYDGDGTRVVKTVGSQSTYYVYGQMGLLSEFTTTSGVTQAASTDRLPYRVA